MSVIKKVASNASLPTEISRSITQGYDNQVEKFAILIHHTDDYVSNANSRLNGERLQHIQQLETLGYTVISIHPEKWQGMALSSTEDKVLFLKHEMGLINRDRISNPNFSRF